MKSEIAYKFLYYPSIIISIEIYRFIESCLLPRDLPKFPKDFLLEFSEVGEFDEILNSNGFLLNPLGLCIIFFFTGLILFMPFNAYL